MSKAQFQLQHKSSDSLQFRTLLPEANPSEGSSKPVQVQAHANEVRIGNCVTKGKSDGLAGSISFSVQDASDLARALKETLTLNYPFEERTMVICEESCLGSAFRIELRQSLDGVRIFRSWCPTMTKKFSIKCGVDPNLSVWQEATSSAIYLGKTNDVKRFVNVLAGIMISAASRDEEAIEGFHQLFTQLARPRHGESKESHDRYLKEKFEHWKNESLSFDLKKNADLDEAINAVVRKCTNVNRRLYEMVADQLPLLVPKAAMGIIDLIRLAEECRPGPNEKARPPLPKKVRMQAIRGDSDREEGEDPGYDEVDTLQKACDMTGVKTQMTQSTTSE